MKFLGLEFVQFQPNTFRHNLNDDIYLVIQIDQLHTQTHQSKFKRFKFFIRDFYTINYKVLDTVLTKCDGDIEELIENNDIYKKLCNNDLMLAFGVLSKQAEKIKILL